MEILFTPVEKRVEFEEVGDDFKISYKTLATLCSALENMGLSDLADKLRDLAYETGVLKESDRIRLIKALSRIARFKKTRVYTYTKGRKKAKLTLGKKERRLLKRFLNFLRQYREYDIQVGYEIKLG